ncbi:MAG: hypothetical protein ABSE90_09665, partial [Verrucomicrobiota bacterium]
TAMPGQTNYYVVTFESQDYYTGATYESPLSNETNALGRNPDNLIPANAVWDVTMLNTNPPLHLGARRAPFGSPNYAEQFPSRPPLVTVNTNWSDCDTWSNRLMLNLAGYTSGQLSNVVYSIAIDNDYKLYVNSRLIEQTHHDGGAAWSELKPLNSFTNLVAGSNNIAVVISGDCDNFDYFSMIVTTNTCGW